MLLSLLSGGYVGVFFSLSCHDICCNKEKCVVIFNKFLIVLFFQMRCASSKTISVGRLFKGKNVHMNIASIILFSFLLVSFLIFFSILFLDDFEFIFIICFVCFYNLSQLNILVFDIMIDTSI
ncbi:hypothetical protein BDE02_05G106200 [Populus trichocarpa]|nr:hypothetical protein BDE02_05G106200 [Populus trichocarpa]